VSLSVHFVSLSVHFVSFSVRGGAACAAGI